MPGGEHRVNIKTVRKNNAVIAVLQSEELLIADVQSALDLIATVGYETGCVGMVLNKSTIAEGFFKLSTGLAGEILQKFINYTMKLAIIGDFSHYSSKPLADFIYESNQGRHIFFVSDEESAIQKLTAAQ